MPKTIVFDGTDIHGMMDRLEKAHGLKRCSCGTIILHNGLLCSDCWDKVRSEEEASGQAAEEAYY